MKVRLYASTRVCDLRKPEELTEAIQSTLSGYQEHGEGHLESLERKVRGLTEAMSHLIQQLPKEQLAAYLKAHGLTVVKKISSEDLL